MKEDMNNQQYHQDLRKKKKKEEPIQKIQSRNKQNNWKKAETATKNNNCGFCG